MKTSSLRSEMNTSNNSPLVEISRMKRVTPNLKKKFDEKVFFLSALDKRQINDFRKDLYNQVRKIHVTRFPYNAFLYPDLT